MKRSLIAFGASIALLLGSLFALDPTALLEQLVRTDLGVFTLGLPAVLLSLVCWSQAFRRLLAASGGPVSSRRAFFAYGTAMFGKQVLPMGQAGGPALMAYTFDREVSLGYNRTFAVVSVAGTAELLRLSVGRLSRRLEAALAPERVDAEIDRYYDTVDEVVADRRAVLVAYALTQAGWVLFTVPLYTGALALGIRLPIALVLFVVPAAGLATVAPLPGGLGGFEIVLGAILVALTGLELAIVAAIVQLYRLCSYWFMVFGGGASSAYGATTVRELVTDPVVEATEPGYSGP